jgi:hypothetical protein
VAPPAGKKAADAKEREQQGLNEPSRYKVTADTDVLGHGPGSVFEEYIPEEQEQQLLEGGLLAKSTAQVKEEPPRQTPAARAAAQEHVPATAQEAAALEQTPLTVTEEGELAEAPPEETTDPPAEPV